MAGGGPDPYGKKVLPCHRPSGGDVEDSGGDFKFPAHSLHYIPRLPTRISGGSRHRYRHPRGQAASAASGLEGGGPVRDLSGLAQGVWSFGQVQVTRDLGRVRRGPLSLSAPSDVLAEIVNGGEGGGILREGFQGISGRDTG